MSEMKVPKIDPLMIEISEQIVKEQKEREKVQYLKDHFFDIFNLIIALTALFISIAGLYLPKSNQPAQQQPDGETVYYNQSNS